MLPGHSTPCVLRPNLEVLAIATWQAQASGLRAQGSGLRGIGAGEPAIVNERWDGLKCVLTSRPGTGDKATPLSTLAGTWSPRCKYTHREPLSSALSP